MKRSIVAATAVALLLTGCATGETGHLDPEIDPDLGGPFSQPVTVGGGAERTVAEEGAGSEGAEGEGSEGAEGEGSEGAEGEGGEGTTGEEDVTAAGGSSGEPANEVEAALVASSGSESWFADVTGVDVDGDSVLVTTSLTEGGAEAASVCQAVVAAAESTGITAPSVEVRTSDGETLSRLDAAAGDEGCSS